MRLDVQSLLSLILVNLAMINLLDLYQTVLEIHSKIQANTTRVSEVQVHFCNRRLSLTLHHLKHRVIKLLKNQSMLILSLLSLRDLMHLKHLLTDLVDFTIVKQQSHLQP